MSFSHAARHRDQAIGMEDRLTTTMQGAGAAENLRVWRLTERDEGDRATAGTATLELAEEF